MTSMELKRLSCLLQTQNMNRSIFDVMPILSDTILVLHISLADDRLRWDLGPVSRED